VAADEKLVVHVATPELTAWVAQLVIAVPPESKLTVPVAPEVTMAIRVMGAPMFCGEAWLALSVVVEESSANGPADTLLDAGPVAVALEAVTLKEIDETNGRSGMVHDVLFAATTQVPTMEPLETAVAVYPTTVSPETGEGAVQLNFALPCSTVTVTEVGAPGLVVPV
jgi:hypothetical protein